MDHIWSPWRMEYIQDSETKPQGCIFCDRLNASDDANNLIVARGRLAFVILNKYPYTSGHLMVVPNNHEHDLNRLTSDTRAELLELTNQAVQVLQQAYHPQAFNLGMNLGKAAGAGIEEHLHMHIVPRWSGDTSFMSTTAGTRVLPETLEDSYQRIKGHWERRSRIDGSHEE